MYKSKLRQITIAAYIALMPFAAEAVGLGRLNVISALGEPLNAEIELLSTTLEELPSLSATIASEEAYAAQGIERTALHGMIKVELSKKVDSTSILKLTTQQPVSDLFLDMLIQVDWSTGRLLREYTVLLDPPGYFSATAIDNNPPMAMPVPPVVEPISVTSDVPEKESSIKSKAAAVTAPETASGYTPADEHTTIHGDTLSTIAMQVQVEGVSLDQMLVGLYRANKNAFVGDNMNRLKIGQIIRAPGTEELQAISRREASGEVRVQTADWNAYRNKLAEIPTSSENVSNQSSGGKLTAAAEDKAALVSTGPRNVVKLSKSDNSGDNNANKTDAKAMQDKLTALQEEGVAREKSVKEANERVAALEKKIANMQKLLTVKNQAMAELQRNAGIAVMAASVATASVPHPAKGVAAKPVTVPAIPTPEVKVPVTPEAKAPSATPSSEVKSLAPVEELGMLDGILAGIKDNILLSGGAGGGLILLGVAWLFSRNRRKHDVGTSSTLPMEELATEFDMPESNLTVAAPSIDMSTTKAEPIMGVSPEVDTSQPEVNAAAEFDLSSISLSMDTAPSAATATSSAREPEYVNTKLDLITAYIDMGDKEGARELLDEVLKEGGVQQRERAQQMLSSLA